MQQQTQQETPQSGKHVLLSIVGFIVGIIVLLLAVKVLLGM